MSQDIAPIDQDHIRRLASSLQRRAPLDAAGLLEHEPDDVVAAVIQRLPVNFATQLIQRLPEERRARVVGSIETPAGEQWAQNLQYEEGTVGRLMSPPVGLLGPQVTVREAVELIRAVARQAMITYAYVVDADERLLGVVVMRDLLLAEDDEKLEDIMVPAPFHFSPQATVAEAMRGVVHRHYPIYPVCDPQRRLIGLLPGYVLFEEHAFEISAQTGRMVGVDEEEHYNTPWWRCFKWRHPWLQLNLLTAFLAAATVGAFEATIAQVVALAVFLPVLAGQSGNTGVQALAVTVRGLTLNEFGSEAMPRLLAKETVLGAANGVFTGLIAAIGMLVYANMTDTPNAMMLAFTVLLAMVGSCTASGISGVVVPLTLKRINVDPASASGIFVTTATDVASMGLFLGAATMLVL